MYEFSYALRPRFSGSCRGLATTAMVLVCLLLATGLNLIPLRPSVGADWVDRFPNVTRIALYCSVFGEGLLTIETLQEEFCEIAKSAIESLAQGKVGPRVAALPQWQYMEAIWPRACDENRPPSAAGEYCYPAAKDIKKDQPYIRVTVPHMPLGRQDPTTLEIKFGIRVMKSESKELLVFSYDPLIENGVTSERTARALRLVWRWSGAVMLLEDSIPRQELFDEIQVTIGTEFTPFVLNMLNRHVATP